MAILPIVGPSPYALVPARSLAERASLDNIPSVTARYAERFLQLDRRTPIDSELNQTNALWQHNVLGQTGVRSEHVGTLIVFGQYAAKAASLPAALGGVWLSADYASLAELKKSLWLNQPQGLLALLNLYSFPWMQQPVQLGPAPAGFEAANAPAAAGQMNLVV